MVGITDTTGYPTLKRAMCERGISFKDIAEYCNTERLATIYDRINHGKTEFSLMEMQAIHGHLFPNFDPYQLFDMTEGDLWDMTYPHLHECDASKYLRRWHKLNKEMIG